MKIADKINDAIRKIERYGWRQGDFGNRLRGYCPLGALKGDRINAYSFWATHTPQHHALLVLELAINGTVSIWNDEPGRTKEQVLAVMRIAASLPEAQREL